MSDRSLSAAEIAALTGAVASSATAARVRRVGEPATADPATLVFATDPATLLAALGSGAGLILAPRDAPGDDARLLRVTDPRLAFALCGQELGRARSLADVAMIHPTAVIDATATLGTAVQVGPGAVIGAGARVGDDAVIGPRAVIAEGVVLGARVVVQAGAVLGSRGFGYVLDPRTGEYLLFPQQGALVVEDDVEIGANTTIDRGALGETRIGQGTKIDNLVHVGHNCRIGRHVVIAAQVGISGSSVVEDGAVLAGQVGISDHCHIGPGVILGGQAGVYRGKTVAGPGQVFAGTPAEPLRDQMRALARLRRLR